jgi:hypothetical protein
MSWTCHVSSPEHWSAGEWDLPFDNFRESLAQLFCGTKPASVENLIVDGGLPDDCSLAELLLNIAEYHMTRQATKPGLASGGP